MARVGALIIVALLIAGRGGGAGVVSQPPGGGFITIDPPGSDGTFTVAFAINDSGEIVGRYHVAGGLHHGFLRSNDGKFTTIDFPRDGVTETSVTGLNSRGDIVGHTLVKGRRHGFLRKNGEFTTIDPPGATAAQAMGINSQGDIVGRYCIEATEPPTPAFCAFGKRNSHGFLLSNGNFTTIDIAGALETNALWVNDRGQILGSYLGPEGRFHLFLLSEGQVTTIDFPGAFETPTDGQHAGINLRGDIVSFYCAAGPLPCKPGNVHGFLRNAEGKFTTIDLSSDTFAMGINARGDIVGEYDPDESHAFGFLLRNPKLGNTATGIRR